MKCIIRHEMKCYFKNPVFYFGFVIMFLGIWQCVSPYLEIHYYKADSELTVSDVISDGDVMNGIIPLNKEEQMDAGFTALRESLLIDFLMEEGEVEGIIGYLKESVMGIVELNAWLEKNYGYYNGDYLFWIAAYKQADASEVNHYMEKRLEAADYTEYFSRKYVDYLGVFLMFYIIILFAFLFFQDVRKDMYELLHTKPIGAGRYVAGKVAGGFLTVMIQVFIITCFFNILCVRQGLAAGFPVSWLDIWKPVILYILPNVFMVACFYSGISLLFKNPLPAAPALFLYMIYSNMGSRNEEGMFGYYGRLFAIIVRFPETFFETKLPDLAVFNQIFLLAAAMVLFAVSVQIYKRRRVY